jgi:hypothetical protein
VNARPGTSTVEEAEGHLITPPRLNAPPVWTVASIWAWPAVAIVAVALTGQFLGGIGAAVAAALVIVTALVVVGLRVVDEPSRPGLVAVALCVGVVAALALVILVVPAVRVPRHVPPDLRGQRVSQADVDAMELRGARLSGAQLAGLDLRDEDLAGATANGASFRRARLDGVSLRGADLRGADLTGACLRGVDLAGALLAGARIDGADVTPGAFAGRNTAGADAPTPPSWCRS